jgi:hypothetical protein
MHLGLVVHLHLVYSSLPLPIVQKARSIGCEPSIYFCHQEIFAKMDNFTLMPATSSISTGRGQLTMIVVEDADDLAYMVGDVDASVMDVVDVVAVVELTFMSPTPLMLSQMQSGMLCVLAEVSIMSTSNATTSTWMAMQAMVDVVDKEEEKDMGHVVEQGMQLKLFNNNTKATGMFLSSREMESTDTSMVLDLAEVHIKDVATRLSRVDS